MTDVVASIIRACQVYWQEVGLPHATARDMGSELEAHLREAAANGQSVEDVVGRDVATFAKEWAAEHLSRHARPLPSWDQVQYRLGPKEPTQLYKWTIGGAVVAVVATALLTSGKESTMDNELWRWVWTVLALVMSIAEIFTAGFFLLPFGIGAGLAAAAAWFGFNGAIQWVLFFGGSAASFVFLRRFMRLQDDDPGLKVGPHRYVGMQATVIEVIDMAANTGRVRVEADEWRAISESETIAAGAIVEVVELRGTRLVVAKVK
jgi:membrane protein implicated in regulation of membrane protease activity